LRAQQVQGASEVLIITGRGQGSVDKVAVVRPAIERMLARLTGHGVVASVHEHTAGSFVVTLERFAASIRRAASPPTPQAAPDPVVPQTLVALPADVLASLRTLATHELVSLGLPATPAFVASEMERRFAALSATLATARDPTDALRAAIRAALEAE
jgi:hypothetical protein